MGEMKFTKKNQRKPITYLLNYYVHFKLFHVHKCRYIIKIVEDSKKTVFAKKNNENFDFVCRIFCFVSTKSKTVP